MDYQKLFEIKKTAKNLSKKIIFSQKSLYGESCYIFTDNEKISHIDEVIKTIPSGANIIFREYNLEVKNRIVLAQKLSSITSKKKHKIVIGKDFKIAQKLKSYGVHYSDKDIKNRYSKELSRDHSLLQIRSFCRIRKIVFSLSLHNLKYLNYVYKLKPDVVFLSPVFSTSSHINQDCIGFIQFLRLSKLIIKKFAPNKNIKITPLGGINLNNLKRLNRFGICGFGGIDFFNNSKTYK